MKAATINAYANQDEFGQSQYTFTWEGPVDGEVCIKKKWLEQMAEQGLTFPWELEQTGRDEDSCYFRRKEFMPKIDPTPIGPQMKRAVGILQVEKKYGYIIFFTEWEIAKQFAKYGWIPETEESSIPNRYILNVDARYDFDEVLEWMKNY